jgi:signal transduction histidine kinase
VFSDDDKKKIFMRFQKLSAQPTGGEPSTGLGLSIVKTLVDKMNGELMVESTVNAGATFTVILPLHLAKSPPLKVESDNRGDFLNNKQE